MLFNEIYSSYYNAVAEILGRAVSKNLTDKALYEIVREKAFAESVMVIPDSLKSEAWPLLLKDNTTPIENIPTMPLTNLQRRWLKTLLSDPRIRLFSPTEQGLEEVKPLYPADTFVYFDRYSDGDPFDDPKYIGNFKTVLKAVREKRKLRIKFTGHLGNRHSWVCVPERIEYSSKDDKFRVITFSKKFPLTVNIARISSCKLLEEYTPEEYAPKIMKSKELELELTDERNALERVMLHFSDLEKETKKIDSKHYKIKLKYYNEDETEILIRVLSFGPMLKVISPDSFIEHVKKRLEKQKML